MAIDLLGKMKDLDQASFLVFVKLYYFDGVAEGLQVQETERSLIYLTSFD
jgi:hypothetical protein